MAAQEQSPNSSGVFNRAAKGFGSWLYQQRHGRHDHRRAEMLARVATFPGGNELLRQAAEMGVDIIVASIKETGTEGYFDASGKKPVIGIANTGSPAAMAVALWHELRHLRQHAANPAPGLAFGGQLKDTRTAHLMGLMSEADAFTAETLLVLHQKKAGHPEYYDAVLAKPPLGPHLFIKRFLREQPYESFADDAAFARKLFTGLMLDGLLAYRAQYFSRLAGRLAVSQDLPSFRHMIANSRHGGASADEGLTALYGEAYASVSPRALATAFWKAQPFDEQQAIQLVEKTVRSADKMTEAEFRAARNEILQRTREIAQKDPDEYQYRGAKAESAADGLTQAAAGGRPPRRKKQPATDVT